MRGLIGIWRLSRMSLHILRGIYLIHLRFGHLSRAERHVEVKRWSGQLLAILGVRLETTGTPRPGAKLVVSNHVSWLDIAAVHAVLPEARFVSKADVRDWPVVGLLVGGVGTLFIERSSKRDALRVVHQMADALKSGDTVAVFPEGTTGAGPELLPFHGNLLQAAIATEVPLQPLALRWHEPGQRFSTSAQFIGGTTIVQSLWRVAKAQGMGVQVDVLMSMSCNHADRRALADYVRQQINEELAPH